MLNRIACKILLLILLLGGMAQFSVAAAPLPEFNQIVLNLIKEYPTDGTIGYWWPRNGESNYDGCSRNLFYRGKQVMDRESEGRTYCCGLTLEVFLRAYNQWLEKHGGETAAAFDADRWPRFQRLWFVIALNGPGPSSAVEEFGIGRTLAFEEVLPGDFLNYWRTKNKKGKITGHSVIFLDWVRDDQGNITGFKYWSSQPSTDGVGERIESFGPDGGVEKKYTFFCRVEPDKGKK